MTREQVAEAFSNWRETHRRPAWRPVTQADQNQSRSWFGGDPIMDESSVWPCCSECQQPMQFLLQLDAGAIPFQSASTHHGLIQLFYCSSDDGECETWAPFNGTSSVRIATEGGIARRPVDIEPLPQSFIAGWEPVNDYPNPQEHERLGIEYRYDFKEQHVSVGCQALGLNFEKLSLGSSLAEQISVAQYGDKLGGWPAWVQGMEYPECPRCQEEMQLLFQLDSEDNLPIMFGDMGCGHITFCERHPEVMTFAWACG